MQMNSVTFHVWYYQWWISTYWRKLREGVRQGFYLPIVAELLVFQGPILQVSSNYFCSAIDSLLVRIQELISLKWWLQWVILVINLQTCCLSIWLARFMGLVLMIGALARGWFCVDESLCPEEDALQSLFQKWIPIVFVFHFGNLLVNRF
jgi:hypothetical protein